MKTIAFFNNKGGVGKTSLAYHLASMYADLGLGVIAADLDPQANLSSMFLPEERLEELWPDGEHPQSILGAIRPILTGTGDIADPHVEDISDNIGLVVGDLGLLTYEDKLSDAWPRCHDRDEAAFRVISAFYRTKRPSSGFAERRARSARAETRRSHSGCCKRWDCRPNNRRPDPYGGTGKSKNVERLEQSTESVRSAGQGRPLVFWPRTKDNCIPESTETAVLRSG